MREFSSPGAEPRIPGRAQRAPLGIYSACLYTVPGLRAHSRDSTCTHTSWDPRTVTLLFSHLSRLAFPTHTHSYTFMAPSCCLKLPHLQHAIQAAKHQCGSYAGSALTHPLHRHSQPYTSAAIMSACLHPCTFIAPLISLSEIHKRTARLLQAPLRASELCLCCGHCCLTCFLISGVELIITLKHSLQLR